MNPKAVFFIAFVVACSAEEAVPERFPAGLDPTACPGYPNCDNVLLHGTEKIEAVPERFPAGLNPLSCPGYPNCDNALLHGTEKIEVLPTYHKSLVPGYKYYSYNELAHLADGYPSVIPSYRTYAPLSSYYRYAPIAPGVAPIVRTIAPIAPAVAPIVRTIAPIAPVVAPITPLVAPAVTTIASDEIVAPVANVAPVAPNKVETINGSPIGPIAPFATLPGIASKLFVKSL